MTSPMASQMLPKGFAMLPQLKINASRPEKGLGSIWEALREALNPLYSIYLSYIYIINIYIYKQRDREIRKYAINKESQNRPEGGCERGSVIRGSHASKL